MMSTNPKTSKTSQRPANRSLLGGALLALFSAGGGCADHVQSAVVSCPCDHGICCASGVCAADEGSCAQATQALSAESAGQWTGYIENKTLPSGSDALKLTLAVEGDGSSSGQLVLGEGTLPAAATDSTVGWPLNYFAELDYFSGHIGLMEGFAYHITKVQWTALRLRFEIELGEPWGPWCRLQQNITLLNQDPLYAECEEVGGSGQVNGVTQCAKGDPTSGWVTVDCNKATLCNPSSGACNCSATACDAGTLYGVAFDIALRGNDGDGSLRDRAFPWGPPPEILGARNVRLIRASY